MSAKQLRPNELRGINIFSLNMTRAECPRLLRNIRGPLPFNARHNFAAIDFLPLLIHLVGKS